MTDDLLKIGKAQASWNVAGTKILKYSVEMFHKGLNDHKVISAPDIGMLQNKANLQAQKWSDIWETLEDKRKSDEQKEASIEKATTLTEEAEKAVADIDNLLIHTLDIDDTIQWESLKRTDDFSEPIPNEPKKKKQIPYPDEPKTFELEFTFLEKLFKAKHERRIAEHECKFQARLQAWTDEKKSIDQKNRSQDQEHENNIAEWKKSVSDWEIRRQAFIDERSAYNQKIDSMKSSYLDRNQDSVVEYCDMVLTNSEYPVSFPKSFEIEYVPDTRILIVEYQLPPPGAFPNVKEVKYISSRKELKETYLPESQQAKMFDDATYKIALRTIHELFEADVAQALDAVSFNGWVRAVNRATGKEENNCILSIQANKDVFGDIDLAKVDPKVCFKNLKGVASSKLSSITPVQPILQMSRTDKRFVEAYAVANTVDTSTNLAAMDWEDFEHLIREIFEKEFQTNGGEVKITQASRDGGVDAVAFDPDPIRGGKIVIQAKRYTNTVGVSAVRDLYGTTLNEGATKGILVSTADYGPDAYEFAKGKPLTLLNGSNLLHLLQKHGYHAKIDLREAKRILSEQE
jgi:restriction system protein